MKNSILKYNQPWFHFSRKLGGDRFIYQRSNNYGHGYNSFLLGSDFFFFILDQTLMKKTVTSNELLAEDVILALILGTCAQST